MGAGAEKAGCSLIQLFCCKADRYNAAAAGQTTPVNCDITTVTPTQSDRHRQGEERRGEEADRMLSFLSSVVAPDVDPLTDFKHHWTAVLQYYATRYNRS